MSNYLQTIIYTVHYQKTGAWVAQWVKLLDLTTHTSLSPILSGFSPGFENYKKVCTRLATASDKVYQLLAHGQWLSLGTPASFTTKTGHHDIAEILLKVALKHQKTTYIYIPAKHPMVGKPNHLGCKMAYYRVVTL